MLKKTAHTNPEQSLRVSLANVTSEYNAFASDQNVTTSGVTTGDGAIDIDSSIRHSLPPSVAAILKDEKIESLFNGHAGIKAKNIKLEADLKDKKIGQDWLIARMRAIDACGYEKKAGSIPPEGNNPDLHGDNANADFFSEEELIKVAVRNGKEVRAFETFVGCPFFTNHQNDDIEKARGKIVNAFYDLEDHCVYTDVIIDAVAYPELARGIREGIMTDVSMGTAVGYSLCSHCGKKASVPDEYCTHIRNQKGKVVAGRRVYEINHDLKFIELSQVVDGACGNCKVINKCMDPDELLQKVADVNKELLKVSNKKADSAEKSQLKEEFFDLSNDLVHVASKFLKQFAFKKSLGFRYASKQDLSDLYNALQQLKKVTVKIINSEEVDYEFVQDLAKVLAELQNLIVDLAEAGFGELPEGAGGEAGAPEGGMEGGDAGMPGAEAPAAPAPAGNAPAPAGAPQGLEFNSPINELQLAAENKKSLYNFAKNIAILTDKMDNHFENVRIAVKKAALANISKGLFAQNKEENKVNLQSRISDNWHKLINKESGLMKSLIEVTEGKYTLRIANNTVTGIHDGEEFSANLDELDQSIVEAYKSNPHKAASMILSSWKAGGIKTAYTQNPPPQDEVQEGQLENLDGNFKRVRPLHEEDYEVMEGRLDEFPISSYTGNTEIKLDGKVIDTGEDRFTRKNMEDLPVQEARLEDRRINDMHMAEKGIQEGQLKDVDASEFGRWTNDQRGNEVPTTEGQLLGQSPYQSAEKDRIGQALNETQEGQLKAKRQGPDAYMAAQAAVNALIKASASAVIERGVSPAQIVGAFSEISKYKNVMAGYVRNLSNKNNKEAKANIVNRLNIKSASREVSAMDIATMILDRVAASSFDNLSTLKSYANYLNKAASHLAENASVTQTAIKKEVGKQLDKIKETSEGKSEFEVKEELEKEAFKKALAGYETENHFFEFFEDELEGTTLEAIAANTLTDSGITVTANNVQTEVINHDKNTGIYTAKVTVVSQPSNEESKLALAMSMLRQVVAQTPPVGTQFGGPEGGDAPAGEAPAGGVGALTTPPPDFSPSEGGDTSDLDAPADEVGGEPQFPGEICPICGSLEVEALDDSYVCKNCDTEFTVKVDVEVLNIGKVLNGGGTSEEGMENEGEAMPEEAGMAPMGQPTPAPAAPAGPTPFPAQASMLIHPRLMVRTANYLGRLPNANEAVAIGQRCPNCASSKVNFEKDNGQCLACSVPYKVSVSGAENGMLKAEVSWMATGPAIAKNLEAEQDSCKECKASVEKFQTKLASLKNNQSLLLKVSERLQKKASASPAKAGMLICQEDRMRDGFSKEASCEICETMKRSLELEDIKQHAQFEEDEEAENVGTLDNPMDNFKDDLTGDEDAVDTDELESVEDMGDDMDSDDDSEFEMLEDDSDDNAEFLDNLPEEDGVSSENVSLDINVNTGSGEQSFEIEIDPATGEVTVVTEDIGMDTDMDSDLGLDSDENDDVIDVVDFSDEGSEDAEEAVVVDDSETEEDVVDFGGDDEDSSDDEADFGGDSEDEEIVHESNEEEENVDGVDSFEGDSEDAGMGSFAMSNSKILPQGRFGGNNIDISAVAAKIGLDKKSVKTASNQLASTHPLLREAANVKLSRTPNMLAGTKLAQNKQTMPLDVEDDVEAGVPRDESVGLKQTQPKEVAEVFEEGYKKDKKNTTKVVPRDNSGDGLGGKSVTFEEEKADKQTSGNPDDYVQTLTKEIKPTPSGNKENKATASSLKNEIKQLVIAHNLDASKLEIADAGSCYLVAHDTRLFKFPKANVTASSNEEVVAKFQNITATVKPNGQIVKSASVSEEAGNKVKPNPVDGKKNKGVMPVNKGVNTAQDNLTLKKKKVIEPAKDSTKVASEDTIKPNPVDGKKNKGVMPSNKGVNTASVSENAGNKVKPNAVDGKKNKGVMPVNKGVATASEDTIEPNKADGKKNKAVAPGSSKEKSAKVAAFVAKKTNASVEDLEVKEFDKTYVVANISTGKIYNVKKN